MTDKIILELTLTEANILVRIIQSHIPAAGNEMIALMLYARIARLIDESS